MDFSLDEANTIIKYIRSLIESELVHNSLPEIKLDKPELQEKRGVFVTLKKNSQLRGCIGFPEPVLPLKEAIKEASKSAAFSDPRFPPVSKDELNDITIEISILTTPQEIKVSSADELLEKIKIGRDGLILRGPYGSGLLLPQVFTEYNCTPTEALQMTCQKAGLPRDAWQKEENKFYSFQADIFCEDSNGKIAQLDN